MAKKTSQGDIHIGHEIFGDILSGSCMTIIINLYRKKIQNFVIVCLYQHQSNDKIAKFLCVSYT